MPHQRKRVGPKKLKRQLRQVLGTMPTQEQFAAARSYKPPRTPQGACVACLDGGPTCPWCESGTEEQ